MYAKGTRYKTHVDRIIEWVKEKNVLDVGAGDGIITHLLGAKGIEIDEIAVKIAQEKGVDVIQGDAYKLPFPDNSFDAVTMFDVLEHLDKPTIALKEARRVAPTLYISTPIKREDGKLSRLHSQEWSPEGLCSLVENEGYKLDGPIIVYPHVRMMYSKFI
jgi:SAM-dependent methyltransferase